MLLIGALKARVDPKAQSIIRASKFVEAVDQAPSMLALGSSLTGR